MKTGREVKTIESIWIVNHYAGGPGIGTGWRHYELGRRWAQTGVSVRVFAASTRIGGEQCPKRVGDREIDGVHLHFVPTRTYGGNGISRVLNLSDFARRVGARMRGIALACATAPSAIIASSPQPFVWAGAARIARETGGLFVPEIRDVWPDSLIELGGMSAFHPLVLASRIAQSRALRRADLLFSPLSRISLLGEQFGIAADRCIVVPNGVSLAPRAPRLPRTCDQGQRTLLYAGAMGLPNSLDGLVDAVVGMTQSIRANLRVLMVGDGTRRLAIEVRAKRECPGVFEFLGALDQPAVQSLDATCDAGVINWQPMPLYRYGISPQKVPMYLSEGLPIVSASPDENDCVRTHQLGWWSPAGETRALTANLEVFVNADANALATMRERCVNYAHEHFNWDGIAHMGLGALRHIGRHAQVQ